MKMMQGALVDDVGEVGTGEAGGPTGDDLQVDVRRHRLALGVDLEDLLATGHVRAVDGDLAVEAARAQQRRVQDVGTVGRGDHDDAAIGVEAVHLDEQLVEGLFAFIVSADGEAAARFAKGVEFVDEDDAGRPR